MGQDGTSTGDHRLCSCRESDYPWGNTRVAVFATIKINRKDSGLTWNAAFETGGILVGDEVTIALHVEFVKA